MNFKEPRQFQSKHLIENHLFQALNPYTVFAATNEAFDKLTFEENSVMEDKSSAASVLLRHIVVFDDVEIPYGQTAVSCLWEGSFSITQFVIM